MKTTLLTTLLFILVSLFSTSCRLQKLINDQDREINSHDLTGNPKHYGTSVTLMQAEQCFRKYDTVMAKYGITKDTSTKVIDLHVENPIIQITNRETFRGKELRKFLHRAARLHAKLLVLPSPIKTSVRVVLGICTRDYARNVIKDSTREGRICLFLASGKFDNNKDPKKSKWSLLTTNELRAALSAHSLTGDDDVPVFDFGGLEP